MSDSARAQLLTHMDRFPYNEYPSRHGAWGHDIAQQQLSVTKKSSREKRERGAVLVELALALPILLLLLLGIIEAGLALSAQITMRQAAAEAARLTAVGEPIGPACGQLNDLRTGTVSDVDIAASGAGTQVTATASGHLHRDLRVHPLLRQPLAL